MCGLSSPESRLRQAGTKINLVQPSNGTHYRMIAHRPKLSLSAGPIRCWCIVDGNLGRLDSFANDVRSWTYGKAGLLQLGQREAQRSLALPFGWKLHMITTDPTLV